MASPVRPYPVVSFILLAGAGYFGAAALFRREAEGSRGTAPPPVAQGAVATRIAARPEETVVATAAEWLARFTGENATPFDPNRGIQLTNWSEEELRRALDAALADPQSILPQSAPVRGFYFLAGESIRRNPAAFSKWLDALPDERTRHAAARYALATWPEGKMDSWLAFLRDHPDLQQEDTSIFAGYRIGQAQALAAGRGAVELAECMKTSRDLNMPQGSIKFPAGFDYPAFLGTEEGRELWKRGSAAFVIDGLMKEDRDRAFELAAGKPAEDRQFGEYLTLLVRPASPGNDDSGLVLPADQTASAAYKSEREQAAWLGGKLAGFSEDERKTVIPSLVMTMQNSGQISDFIDALPTPEAQDLARKDAARKIQYLGVGTTLSYLEGIRSPAERISWLETMDVLPNSTRDANSGKVTNAGQSMDTAPLSSALMEWGATPEQISNILDRVRSNPSASGH